MWIKCNQIVTEDEIISGYIEIVNDTIQSITTEKPEKYIDYSSCIILPGIIDIHNHGFRGTSFLNEKKKVTIKELIEVCKELNSVGVTGLTPAAELEVYPLLVDIIESKQDLSMIYGIYSEGPFGSKSGENIAVKEDYIPPSVELTKQYIESAKGYLKVMGLAVEVEGAEAVISLLKKNNIIVSACHTNANYAEANHSFDLGVTLTTHTGNVMRGIHHRDVGCLGACLLNSNIYCEIICDFHHLSKEMLEIMFRIKKNNRFILVSDSTYLSGVQPGEYEMMDGYMVTVSEDKTIRDLNGRYCGSATTVLDGMRNLVFELKISLIDVGKMSALYPAQLLGLDHKLGSIKIGKQADMIVLSNTMQLIETYKKGNLVYKAH